MRRTALLLGALVLLLSGLAAYFLLAPDAVLPGGPFKQATANSDPRALTPGEDRQFLALVCAPLPAGAGASPYGTEYAHRCGGLLGGGQGMGDEDDLSFTSVMYGHFTDAVANQAYVSYQGSFESHAANFGGAVLFNKTASGWALAGWYSGGQMDECISLNPSGQAKMLCLSGGEGQGEITSLLSLETVPPSPEADGPQYHVSELKADDARQTMTPGANCDEIKAPDEAVLLGLDHLVRSTEPGAVASVQATYVAAGVAEAACKAGDFDKAPSQTAAVKLGWDGKTVTVTAGEKFAVVTW